MIEENNVFPKHCHKNMPAPYATQLISILHISYIFSGACRERERGEREREGERDGRERANGVRQRVKGEGKGHK